MAIKDDMQDVQEAVINELITENGLSQAYLPLTGGSLTGNLTIPANGTIGINAGNALQLTSSSHAVFILGGSVAFRLTDAGHVIIPNIPTSASNLSSGTIYSDGGTLKIVT